MLGSVQISGEEIGDLDTNDICDSLRNNSVRLLSLRGCKLKDHNFQKVMESLKENNSLIHLNLNLGLVNSRERLNNLTNGIKGNTSLTILMSGNWINEKLDVPTEDALRPVFRCLETPRLQVKVSNLDLNSTRLHGSLIGDEGLSLLTSAVENHPSIHMLDLGDCQLGDEAIATLCQLLKQRGSKNMVELSLTGNKDVTQTGWASLALALANASPLQRLFLDYNNIGDFGAGLFAVALSASKHLTVLDLEGTGITDSGAEILCDALETHNNTLLQLNLQGNDISEEILSEINECLNENNNAKKFAS